MVQCEETKEKLVLAEQGRQLLGRKISGLLWRCNTLEVQDKPGEQPFPVGSKKPVRSLLELRSKSL